MRLGGRCKKKVSVQGHCISPVRHDLYKSLVKQSSDIIYILHYITLTKELKDLHFFYARSITFTLWFFLFFFLFFFFFFFSGNYFFFFFFFFLFFFWYVVIMFYIFASFKWIWITKYTGFEEVTMKVTEETTTKNKQKKTKKQRKIAG